MSAHAPASVLSALKSSKFGKLSYNSILNSDASDAERRSFFDEVTSPPPFSSGAEKLITQRVKRLSLDGHTPCNSTHTPQTPSSLHTPHHTPSSHHTLSSHHTPSSHHPPSSHSASRGYSLNVQESDSDDEDCPDAATTSSEQLSHIATKGDSPVECVEEASEAMVPSEEVCSALENLRQNIAEGVESIDDQLLVEKAENIRFVKKRFDEWITKCRQEAKEKVGKLDKQRQEKQQIEEQQRMEREEQENEEIEQMLEELREKHEFEAKIMEAKLKSGEEQSKEIKKNMEENRRKENEKLMSQCVELTGQASQIETKIAALFQSCSHTKFLSETVVSKFRAGLNGIKTIQEQLSKERQSGQPDSARVSHFHTMLNGIRPLLAELKAGVEKANLQGEAETKKQQSLLEEAAKKLEAAKEAERQAQETEKKKEEEKRKESKEETSGLSISKSMLEPLSSLQDILSQTLETCKSLMSTQDSALKQYRFDLQKAITGSINQVSSNSGQDLLQKIFNLKKLLSGQSVQVGTKSVNVNGHPDAKMYCFNLLAAKLVKQGEDQVASSLSAAFPLAALAVGIWTEFEDAGHYILAHFYSVCPVLVPMYVNRTKNMSEAEYMKSLGYVVSSDGKVENQDLFLNRVRGTIRLYAAIIQTPQLPTGGTSRPHPHGLEHGWAWLARMLNIEPRPVVTAAALGDFLEIAGHSLMKKYTKQFQKLLYALWKEYIPKIEKVTSPADRGPLARLTQFLEDCISAGKIPEPKGCLTEQFWRARSSGIQTA